VEQEAPPIIARRVNPMNPHYYLMRNKKILRLEAEVTFLSLPLILRERVLHPEEIIKMDQEQANWRVVLFRDEIMELEEYSQWLSSPEALWEEEADYDLTAN
jgi:hypothetical protein